ncbi:MAG: Bax inhibitor-1/YccA family protein [Phycisphaerales bacterium]
MSVLQTDQAFGGSKAGTMTLGGTLTATSILLSIVAGVGIVSWQSLNASYAAGNGIPGWVMPVMIATLIAGIVVSMVIYRKPKAAPFIAPLHAALEGAFVGVATFVIPMRYIPVEPGASSNPMVLLAIQAAVATFAVAGAMLFGYATGVIRVGPVFQKIMMTALMGLVVYIVAIMLLGFFGVHIWNGFADAGPMGIGFSVLVIGLASMFLILDFQYIEEGINHQAPKYMEWVGAWGLMITLVWLYIEILRLLSKMRSND